MSPQRLLPSAKRFLSAALPALALLLVTFRSAAADASAVWPFPAPPPGTNLATYPEPRQDWLDRFGQKLAATKGKQYSLIFDGDSITDFWQGTGRLVWAQHYAPLNAVDFGIAGDRTEQVLWRLANGQVDGMDPKLVVLMIGTNNLGRETPDQIADGVKACVAAYEKACPTTHILLLAVFPRSPHATDLPRTLIASINQVLSHVPDTDTRVTYLDIGSKFLDPDGTLTAEIMPDFLHPSAKGYQIWADAIQPVIDQYFPPGGSK